MEYRKSIPLAVDTEYWFVEMGPIPDKPAWHQDLYRWQSYPFPTERAALLFAGNHAGLYPGRHVAVRYPNGNITEV